MSSEAGTTPRRALFHKLELLSVLNERDAVGVADLYPMDSKLMQARVVWMIADGAALGVADDEVLR